MLLRLLELGPSLNQSDCCGIEILSRDRTLIEQVLAAVEKLLLGIQILFCRSRIRLSFLQFLRYGIFRRNIRLRLSLLQTSTTFLSGCCEILILELYQQLSLMNLRSAGYVRLQHGGGDLGSDRCLIDGKEQRIGRDGLRNAALLHWRSLHRHNRLRLTLLL